MTNHAVSNHADLRERTKTISRHGDRRGQIADFRGSFETINWLFKCGIKTKTHFEWLLWHWSSLGQLNLEPTRPNGLVGFKVPTDLVKISVKEATHMGFHYIIPQDNCPNIDCLNTLRPRQNGRHFPDDIFKYIFLNENVWISIAISLNYVHKSPPGDKPLSEPMMARLLMHICVTRPQWVNQNVSKHRSFYYFFYQVSSLFVWVKGNGRVWFKLLHCHINFNLGYIPHIEMAHSTKEIFCTKFLQGPFY